MAEDRMSGAANLIDLAEQFDVRRSADRMDDMISELFPICRSITGNGVRESLRIVSRLCPLNTTEVPTGTKVFDWTIPNEWNIRDAYIDNMHGQRIVDFRDSNLHVVSYSTPISAQMSFTDLRPHLHSLPEKPEWIPYRTAYYNEDWGFCLADKQLRAMQDDQYYVHIDTTLQPGSLTYGERRLPGETEDTVLLFAHTCHPSLANDNLSGVVLLAELAALLAEVRHHFTYHFVFAPATIGSITWLSRNQDILPKIKHGLVASVVGDDGEFHYKRTFTGRAGIDRAAVHVLQHATEKHQLHDFSPWGYDERQFGSPGIALPVGRLTRTPNGMYPEYHTSADNLELVKKDKLAGSLRIFLKVLGCLESDRTFRNLQPYGEPQLGRRGLYRKMGGFQDIADTQLAMLWILNMSNGKRSLLEIAEKSGIEYRKLHAAATALLDTDLLEPI